MAAIDQLLKIQHENHASDLHLSPGNPPLLRIFGEMRPIGQQRLTHGDNHDYLYEIMNDAQKREFEAELDFDFAYEIPEFHARFRVNIFTGRLGLSAVIRLIPIEVMTAEQLGLPPIVNMLARQKKGLVVVTGATGSGKSTTLAALVDIINKSRQEHILTIEDPIEFVHHSAMSLINQREVGPHTRKFANALRAALREDPDVILVGEMRDLETMELAITAAETGHLVLATLHTNTAIKTVDRILNSFPAGQQAQIRAMLSESLLGVIAQNLIRTPEGKRVGAFEVLVNTPAIANLIREGKSHQIHSAMQMGQAQGMITMDDAIRQLVAQNRVAVNDAMRFLSGPLQSTARRTTISAASPPS